MLVASPATQTFAREISYGVLEMPAMQPQDMAAVRWVRASFNGGSRRSHWCASWATWHTDALEAAWLLSNAVRQFLVPAFFAERHRNGESSNVDS